MSRLYPYDIGGKIMKRTSRAFTVAALIMAVSCVNIPDTMNLNIDVTIRHIQEQAGEILDFVEGNGNADDHL